MATQAGLTMSLTTGSNLLSNKLKFCLSPMGYLFRFSENQPHKPRPMSLTIIIVMCLMPVVVILVDYSVPPALRVMASDLHEYDLLTKSMFLSRLVRFFTLYRLAYQIAVLFLPMARYGSTASVIASNNNMVSEKEQRHFARQSFAVFLFKTMANSASYAVLLVTIHLATEGHSIYGKLIPLVIITLINLTTAAPLMYACYLGSILGKHVENFSMHYVDTMFDQFMKAIEIVGTSATSDAALKGDTSANSNEGSAGPSATQRQYRCVLLCSSLFGAVRRLLARILLGIMAIARVLNTRKYPELPEMKMTKLSSTTDIQITETKRIANTHLIRIRLRRTQIMLSELRDMVSDINKLSSPIIMMQILFETMLIICIATASIQARVYKTLNFLILPTVTNTIGLVVSVTYVCICLDETTSQLKLMINKLFDFIILNHRVKTIRKPEDEQMYPPGTRLSPAMASEREKEALSETWSQFQYTRKLANTIRFTMGGIVPVSRRLVLSIFGHVLSAVFLSIEAMSIIDTSYSSSGSHEQGHAAKNLSLATADRSNASLVSRFGIANITLRAIDGLY